MKKDLYLDFDSTIVNADQAICDIYNETYKDYEDFKPARWQDHQDWSYKYSCPLIHQHEAEPVKTIQAYYGSQAFFDHLEFYEDAYQVIQKLSEVYNIIICTSAFPLNASKKVLWIEEHLPMIHEIIILINKAGQGYGKGRVAMMEEDAIFIDDHPKNLHSTNAADKYLYKTHDTNYNQDWEGPTVSSWKDIENLLL